MSETTFKTITTPVKAEDAGSVACFTAWATARLWEAYEAKCAAADAARASAKGERTTVLNLQDALARSREDVDSLTKRLDEAAKEYEASQKELAALQALHVPVTVGSNTVTVFNVSPGKVESLRTGLETLLARVPKYLHGQKVLEVPVEDLQALLAFLPACSGVKKEGVDAPG